MAVLEAVVPFAFCAGMMVTIAGLLVDARILRRLRAHHPEVWERLGSPTMVMNNSIQNNSRVRRFIRKREYLPLNDAKLVASIRWRVALERIFFLCFAVTAVAIVAALR